jgi:5-methylcytosine-specific restriction protein B
MNTADRSVESLDTALRRRFSFVEMQPDLNVLKEKHSAKGIISIDTHIVDMVKMLEMINKRIEILIDKDHKIGHSFFINISNFQELQLVFKDKIIPLMEEYFFGDFGKIGLVLGENFIKNANTDNKDIFAKFDDYEDRSLLTDKLVYEIVNPINVRPEHFISIYE